MAVEHDLDVWAAAPSAVCRVRQRQMAHAREYDDVSERAPMHAYSTILPAALAVGEAEGRTGKDLLAAVTVTADVQRRVALASPL
jgi:2-methylcitrate dehydratase PrpD